MKNLCGVCERETRGYHHCVCLSLSPQKIKEVLKERKVRQDMSENNNKKKKKERKKEEGERETKLCVCAHQRYMSTREKIF